MAEKHLALIDYSGDPNIGMYGVATDSYAVLAPGFKEKEFLGVETIVETPVSNTYLTGIFVAGNSRGLLVSNSIAEHEKQALEESGIRFMVVDSRHNALGNLVLANDNGCYVSRHLEEHVEEIESFLDVPVVAGTVAGLDIVGSAGVCTNEGVLLHREAEREELERIEEVLGVEGDIGTVNFGSPYVGTGIVANSGSALIGRDTKGPETARIEKALGFLR